MVFDWDCTLTSYHWWKGLYDPCANYFEGLHMNDDTKGFLYNAKKK